MKSSVLRDAIEVARRRVALGTVDRRQFLAALGARGAAGALASLGGGKAEAAAKEIVFSMWGGGVGETAYAEAWGAPYTAETGIPVVITGDGPTGGKIRSQVETNSVIWDVCDQGIAAGGLAKAGLLRDLDYGVIDRDRALPEFTSDWGVTGYVFSSVLAFDRKALGDKVPSTWADFWDVEQFPGKRTLWKYMEGTLEAALLADGVAPEDLYPLDIDRAVAKIAALKDHLILWETAAESEQLLRDGEVTMGQIWNTRAQLLREETGGQLDYSFNQAVSQPGIWIVPKGNPAGDEVMPFIASMADPERQLLVLQTLGNGPANPETEALYTPELAAVSPSSSENMKLQVKVSPAWYADNYDEAFGKFFDAVAS